MADSAGVIALSSTENMLMEAKSFAVPILAEILNESSLHLLEAKPRWQMKPEDEDKPSKREAFYKHPRFASGGVFVMNALGGMIAQAYYTRGVIEMFIQLVVGMDQEYIPWQIMLPEKYVGKSWRELVTDLLSQTPRALPLGLYRPCETGKVLDSWFMYTNPPPDSTILYKEDLITLLGNAEFGKKCNEEKSLATLYNKLDELARKEWGTGQRSAPESAPGADVVGAVEEDGNGVEGNGVVESSSADDSAASSKPKAAGKKKPKAAAKPKGK